MARKLLGTNPTYTYDATAKTYVDSLINGAASVKPSATVVAISALPSGTYSNGTSGTGATFTVTATGTTTIDGHVLAATDVVLVTAQASGFQNGLYTVTTAGTTGVSTVFTRSTAMDTSTKYVGAVVNVYGGSTYADTIWFCTNQSAPTVGTTGITFSQLSLANLAAPTADFSMNSHKVTNVTDPSGAQDAATQNYIANGTVTMVNKTLTNPNINNYTEGVVNIGVVGSSCTLSIADGTLLTAGLSPSTACTFTMPTATAGDSFVLLLKQEGNGTATFTGVKWPGDTAPTITATAGKMDVLSFWSDGSVWYGGFNQAYTPTLSFIAFNEENTARTNQTVPSGTSGCYVTMIGGGGGGGGGTTPSAGSGNGGAGGGGGSFIQRTFVAAASLGSTYSVTQGTAGTAGNFGNSAGGTDGGNGGNSTFSTGSVTLTAYGGSGGSGGYNATPTGGAGGITPTSSGGITLAGTETGQAGGTGGYSSNLVGQNGGNSTYAGAGGGGGGANISTANNGGAGGHSMAISTGGTAGAATGGAGGTPADASYSSVNGEGGAGGGGGAGGASFTGGGVGGNGSKYGAGGGGGGGKQGSNATGGNGGAGAVGYTLIEWI